MAYKSGQAIPFFYARQERSFLYLVHPKKEKSAIYVRFYYHNRELACTTGVSIETRFWDSKKQAPRKNAPNYTTYKIYLARIEPIITQYYNKCFEEGQLPTPEEIRLHLRSTLKNQNDAPQNFLDYLMEYYRWQQENKTPALTLKITRTLYNLLAEFEQTKLYPLGFNRIDKAFEEKISFECSCYSVKLPAIRQKAFPKDC